MSFFSRMLVTLGLVLSSATIANAQYYQTYSTYSTYPGVASVPVYSGVSAGGLTVTTAHYAPVPTYTTVQSSYYHPTVAPAYTTYRPTYVPTTVYRPVVVAQPVYAPVVVARPVVVRPTVVARPPLPPFPGRRPGVILW